MPHSDASKPDFQRIVAQIESDASPVGIDAKTTHVLILLALERIERRLSHIEVRLSKLDDEAAQGEP